MHGVANTIDNVGHGANRIAHRALLIAGTGGQDLINLASHGIKGAANLVTKVDPDLLGKADGIVHRFTNAIANVGNDALNAAGDAAQAVLLKGTGFVGNAVNQFATAIAPPVKPSPKAALQKGPAPAPAPAPVASSSGSS